jgi:hypothetical protein
MFGEAPGGEKIKKLETLFKQLCPKYQDHLLKHLNLLLELQDDAGDKKSPADGQSK